MQKIPVYSYDGATFDSTYYPAQFRTSPTAYGLTWAINQDGTENQKEYLKYEPFGHTNAVMWEYYAAMGAGELGNHHNPTEGETANFFTYNGISDGLDTYVEHSDPGDIDNVEKNPSCKSVTSVDELESGKCDLDMGDGTTRHYIYRNGELIDPHYEGEASLYLRFMSRGVVSPTVHFGVTGEVMPVANGPATNPDGDVYDYIGVYSVFGNTGYFSEQVHYTNTIDPELFVLTKEMVDAAGNSISAAPDEEFTFKVVFDSSGKTAMTDTDSTLHYWKGNKETLTSTEKWTDSGTQHTYTMPENAPKLDEYEQYLDEADTYRLKPIAPDENTEPNENNTHTYTVKLKANEAIVFYGLIAGTKFTVTEVQNPKYPVVPDKGGTPVDAGYTQKGTILRASEDPLAIDPAKTPTNRADFRNLLRTGGLTVQKKIKNDDPDENKDFGFTVTFTAAGMELNEKDITAKKYKADGTEYDSTEFTFAPQKDGDSLKAEITLKHDEKLEIVGIPLGTKYNVEETQKDGYNLQHVAGNSQDEPESNGNYLQLTSNSVEGTVNDPDPPVYLLFVNERAPVLPFVGGVGVGAIELTGVLLIGLAAAFIVLKKRSNRRARR